MCGEDMPDMLKVVAMLLAPFCHHWDLISIHILHTGERITRREESQMK